MPDQFLREIPETVDKVKTWDWSRKGAVEVETEALIFAAQEQALRANYVKFKIDMLGESPLCRFCVKQQIALLVQVPGTERVQEKPRQYCQVGSPHLTNVCSTGNSNLLFIISSYNTSICITYLRKSLHSQSHHAFTNGYSTF